jgi:hypothetical protein
MADRTSSHHIRSEPRGPHWVAWIEDTSGKPLRSVVLVGRNKKEAEARARTWADSQEIDKSPV